MLIPSLWIRNSLAEHPDHMSRFLCPMRLGFTTDIMVGFCLNCRSVSWIDKGMSAFTSIEQYEMLSCRFHCPDGVKPLGYSVREKIVGGCLGFLGSCDRVCTVAYTQYSADGKVAAVPEEPLRVLFVRGKNRVWRVGGYVVDCG
jgi:hypothetical protein